MIRLLHKLPCRMHKTSISAAIGVPWIQSPFVSRLFSSATDGERASIDISDITSVADVIHKRLIPVQAKFERDNLQERLMELDDLINDDELWEDPDRASSITQEHGRLKSKLGLIETITNDCESTLQLAQLAELELELDEDGGKEMLQDCYDTLLELDSKAKSLEVETVFDSPNDKLNCFVEIAAGAGGKESQDFAQMLLKMYVKWAEQSGHKIELMDTSYSEGGIKGAMFKISGENMFGWFKNEQGTHRMVRISKHDSNGKRHTCFAQVVVLPEFDSRAGSDFQIDPSEIRVDTYRASGPGGQHVNTTDSAVRVTHLPTGLMAQCQNGRSQHQNKLDAMNVLRSRIMEVKMKEEQAELQSMKAEAGENTWGNQIRSYVLNPYQLVKDHRNGTECTQVDQMFEGEPSILLSFMEAQLLLKLKQNEAP